MAKLEGTFKITNLDEFKQKVEELNKLIKEISEFQFKTDIELEHYSDIINRYKTK